MKTIWNFLVAVGESIHRAREATRFTRNGQFDKARDLMTQ